MGGGGVVGGGDFDEEAVVALDAGGGEGGSAVGVLFDEAGEGLGDGFAVAADFGFHGFGHDPPGDGEGGVVG